MIPMQEVIWASFLGVVTSAVFVVQPCLRLGAGPRPWLVSYYRDVSGEYDGALLIVAGLNVLSGDDFLCATASTKGPSTIEGLTRLKLLEYRAKR
ncbi:MAG: hypothetical protein CM15mP120_02130 [Pseudomonadota bacterium]|nr:MAG: hypothetical protein CM15mP120_02130 [Pseudomonadota bacterium]